MHTSYILPTRSWCLEDIIGCSFENWRDLKSDKTHFDGKNSQIMATCESWQEGDFFICQKIVDELNYFVFPLPRPAQLCTLDPPGLRKKRLWSAAAAVGRVFDLPTSSHSHP